MPRPSTCNRTISNGGSQEPCQGKVQTVYIRRGTPSKWTALGRACLRCGALEPYTVEAVQLLALHPDSRR
jgi:hypothetical protein